MESSEKDEAEEMKSKKEAPMIAKEIKKVERMLE